jgi:tetratricopeptide (TPR) repeat protein
LARSDLEGAYGSYVEALSIQNELGEKNSATYTQLSLAEVSLLRGQTAQAETLFRQTADDFRSQKDDDDESLARAGLTRALVLEKRLTEAQQEERRATEHANRSADVTVRLTVAIASARLSASLGRYEEASRILRASLAEATKAGLLSFQFETQLALGEIAMMSGNDMDGRVVLNLLKKSANARGFSLIARRAGSLVARK